MIIIKATRLHSQFFKLIKPSITSPKKHIVHFHCISFYQKVIFKPLTMMFMIPEFIQYFFSHIIINMIIYPKFAFFIDDSKIRVEKKNQDSILSKRLPLVKDGSMQGDEVMMVMGSLGIFCDFEGENLPKSLSCNDLFNMFEEEEPRLDEVKEAFDVFDENKDGYIDARELQRVLFALGLTDKVDMIDCKKMIRVFDENDDGRIDFDEFVKFMDGTFRAGLTFLEAQSEPKNEALLKLLL